MVRGRAVSKAIRPLKSGLCKAWAPLGHALRAWHEVSPLSHLVFGTCGAGKGGGASALLVVPQLPQYGAKHVRNLRKEPQELSPAGRSK